jgi:hypothetical protein
LCIAALSVTAQNKRYLLLEYIKVKPGITSANPVTENTRERIQQQREKDNTVLTSSLWEVVNSDPNSSKYQYIVASIFSNFNDYLAEYKNRDSNMFFSVSKDRFDSVSLKKSDSFDVVYAAIFEILAEAGVAKQPPQYVLNTDIKATSGNERSYESLEMTDWLAIHQDLIKKGYERSFNFSKLIFPDVVRSSYNYCTLLFFDDEAMFDKQNDIDWEPYMRANQSAFISSGRMRTEVHSELLKLVTVLDNDAEETSKKKKSK